MTKAEARRVARARIAGLSPGEMARASAAIARRLWELPEVGAARTLLLYASTPDEVDTDPIAAEATRRGIRISYPRCLVEPGEMALHSVTSTGQLQAGGRYGLREPQLDCEPVAPDEVDVALVPGLAWDRTGMRLGRGAGFYDRLLARPEWKALTCGIFFAAQELEDIPADPWDRPLAAVVTELESLRFGD